MDYAILRLKKRRTPAAGAMARHALRHGEVPNADPARRNANSVLVGASTAPEVVAALRAKLPQKRRKDAVTCVEFFVGASPEAMHAMPREKQDAYFREALEFLGDRFGGRENIVSAVVHRDEATPHMQVLLVPLLDGKLNAKKLVGDREQMRDLQTQFAERAGKPFGLRRGEEGSPAKHTSIAQFYGAIETAAKLNALPPRVEVPHSLPKPSAPGLLASSATRRLYDEQIAAHEAREQERKAAMQANAGRQETIERLARLGLAVHGRAGRNLPQRLAKAEESIKLGKVAEQMIEVAQERLERFPKPQHAEIIKEAWQRVEKPSEAAQAPSLRRIKPK